MSNDKLYTAADLEQARADERARYIEAIKSLDDGENEEYNMALFDAMQCVQDLGPIGKTREQIAADERARCIEAANGEKWKPEPTTEDERTYNWGINHAISSIRALGPIGETREETEKRVVDAALKYLTDHGYCDDDLWAELDKAELLETIRRK